MPSDDTGNADQRAKALASAGATVLCSKPEHMLEPVVCSYVAEILGPWLSKMQFSPLELLTDKRALEELKKAAPIYTAAIVSGAQLQVGLVGGDVSERARALEVFAEDYFRFVGSATTAPLEISPATIDNGYRGCIQHMGDIDGRRHFILSVVHYLDNSPSWGTKVERLVGLLEICTDEETIQVLDEVLAGILEMEAAAADTFVEEKNPFALLQDLMGLITSIPTPRRRACKIVHRLTKLMAVQDLKFTRGACQAAFRRIVAFTKTFNSPDKLLGKKLMLWELTELSKLYKKMEISGGWFVGDALVNAMETQVARRTGLIQLDEYTEKMSGVFAKTIELLRIYPLVFGEKNKLRLLEKILGNVTHRDLSHQFAMVSRAPLEQLSYYGVLDQKIRKAKLPTEATRQMCQSLSQKQEDFIRDKQVFNKFRYLRATTAEKGLYVLEMLMVGAFTAGRCRRAAIKLLLYFVSSKQQLLEYLGSTGSSDDHEERTEEIVAMYDYFVATMDTEPKH